MITTDQGTQFESRLFTELVKVLGSKRIRTSTYHPKANGLVERFHRVLKTAIRCTGNSIHWAKELPLVLLGIRTSVKNDLNCSPAEMLYGEKIRLPGELFVEMSEPTNLHSEDFISNLCRHFETLKPTQTRVIDRNVYVSRDFNSCDHVLLRVVGKKSFSEPLYEGPFKVLKKYNKNYVIERNGKPINVSIDRLKPAFLKEELNNHKKVTFV